MTPETLTLAAAGFFAALSAWSFCGEVRSRRNRARRLRDLLAERARIRSLLAYPTGWKSTD